MRNYLYVWNDPAKRQFVASGIELNDLVPSLASGGGIYLLRHEWDDADEHQNFDFVSAADLPKLVAEDVYSWGDLVWVDYPPASRPEPQPPDLPPESVAELLYFGHALKPLRDTAIAGLGNRFLAWGHDDGWRLVIWYTEWRHIEDVLATVLAPAPLDTIRVELRDGISGFWLEGGTIEKEVMTLDIDGVMNRRIAD